MLLYYRGRIDPALRQLRELEGDRALREARPRIREVRRNLEVVRGKYEEGFSAYRNRRAAEARREWEYVMEADRALLPAGVESFYRQEITRLLGDLYYELGDEDYKRQRLREAFANWSEGKRAAPKHGGLLNGLLRLEEEARKAMDEAQGLKQEPARAKIQLARDITLSDSRVHLDAVKALGP